MLRSSLLSGLRWYIPIADSWERLEQHQKACLMSPDWEEPGKANACLQGLFGFFWERVLWQEIKPNSSIQMGVSNIRKAFVSFSLPWWNWASSMNHYLLLEIHCCSEYICKQIVAPPLLFAVLKYTDREKKETQYSLLIKNCWISLIVVGWPWPAARCPPSHSPPPPPAVTELFLTYFSSFLTPRQPFALS